IGTLVHGYLWALIEVFDCQYESVGRQILAEVTRRKGHGIWVREVEYPPLALDRLREVTARVTGQVLEQSVVKHEELKAFDNRAGLVDALLEHYETTAASPAPSAPGSPGRRPTLPVSIDRTNSSLSAKPLPDPAVLGKTRQALMVKWSREDCLAAIAAMAPKS
ncbi:plasma membrane localization protein, partial [Teratosphaeriaceae sp. CCFEE 6253]